MGGLIGQRKSSRRRCARGITTNSGECTKRTPRILPSNASAIPSACCAAPPCDLTSGHFGQWLSQCRLQALRRRWAHQYQLSHKAERAPPAVECGEIVARKEHGLHFSARTPRAPPARSQTTIPTAPPTDAFSFRPTDVLSLRR
jgi:hypothetical protein